ncbi:PREDICTED: nuclear RNA export factor 1-like [Wasmannia auropunctata]|uniref:nuclear RNA export factor 1-like n=1 Tax=Wasmannia auropunctata TaxID=64793 RepID=UPI0005EED61E|nr:PREDICTED: nuclear RNA export factor 1-like [Wasmannia auropunctata]XP_011685813.1 PREDICTED: nuclear RNA export factor 1-like [Wasmannia auropunctata]
MLKLKENLKLTIPKVAPVLLDTAIAIRIAMGAKLPHERGMMNSQDLWHKIKVLKGGLYDKDTVLKGILRAVEPNDLIPVKYQVCGEDAYFVARNCGPAIEMLCKANMIIRNAKGDAIILVVTLGFSTINDLRVHLQPILLTALTKRYDPNKKTLNLENFHTDPNVEKSVYCPLSQLKIFNHVLSLAKTAIATVEHLNLQHNELLNISAMENADLTSIRYLDLRHNNLLNMNTLAPLKNMNITRLWLDGNPLCENYSTAKQYVDSAKTYCRNLQELDGVYIVENLPLIYRDYFPNDKAQAFAESFVTHFFALFDQLDRTVLRGLYHKDAFYSMSCAIPNNIAQKTNLNQYTSNRNLLKKGAKKNTCLYYGQEDIFVAFSKLPRTYHDKSSFTYDMLYDDGKCVAFSVAGLCKKLSSGINVLSFSRTFVLTASLDNEYHILNDQYHIWAAPNKITPDKILVKHSFDEMEPVCFSPSEKSVLVTRIRQITKMNQEWSETYLKQAQWDMRKAISNFMKDLKSSEIPDHAFVPK